MQPIFYFYLLIELFWHFNVLKNIESVDRTQIYTNYSETKKNRNKNRN